MHDPLSQDRDHAAGRRRPHPRRVRVAESVYQRIDRRTGKPVPGKFEFTYRDATGRQVWQTVKGETKADAKAERAELVARMHKGSRVERTNLTVSEVAELWLERASGPQGRWKRATLERYGRIVRRHIDRASDPSQRPIGSYRLRELTVDRIATWSAANERAIAPTTALTALISLNQICRMAVRRGWLADNPVEKLEAGEKPRWTPKRVSILEGEQLAQVLAASGNQRPLFELLAYTGLRIGEALGLTWNDIDHNAGLIHVHQQLTRWREHGPLKTEASRRDVVLAPSISKLLREQWLASSHKQPSDLVFCTKTGRGLDYRHIGAHFHDAISEAGVTAAGRLSLHSLRHGYASLLISQGLNVVFVSRQLGHANPTITLSVYAHLYAQADHAQSARNILQAGYDSLTNSSAG